MPQKLMVRDGSGSCGQQRIFGEMTRAGNESMGRS